ncbi:MAG: ABC transporter substrate-binding protein [Eubacteriales bacterium]|nr:ABC transporter substrate-binding protein [Eubacteriales bacterium]
MKKFLALLLAACMALGMVSAALADEPVTITFWEWWSGAEDEYLQSILKDFTAETGIVVETLPVQDMTKVMTAIAGGTPPDLCGLTSRAQLIEMARNGAALAIDDYMARDSVTFDTFLPTIKDAYTIDGKVYGFPFLGFNFGLYWNKDLFAEAGLDPETPPQTAEELVEYAHKLTKVDENGKITQLGIPVYNWLTDQCVAELFGGKIYDAEKGEFTLTDPAVIAALQWMRDLYEGLDPQAVADYIASCGAQLTPDGPFESGRIAMDYNGCWCVAFHTTNVPNLNYGTCAMPASKDHPEKAGASMLEYNPYFIPAGCEHPEEAWQLLKWLCTNPTVVAKFADFCANIDHLTVLPEGYTSPLFDNPNFKTFIDLANNDLQVPQMVYPRQSECTARLYTVQEQLRLDPSLDILETMTALNDELNALIHQ